MTNIALIYKSYRLKRIYTFIHSFNQRGCEGKCGIIFISGNHVPLRIRRYFGDRVPEILAFSSSKLPNMIEYKAIQDIYQDFQAFKLNLEL